MAILLNLVKSSRFRGEVGSAGVRRQVHGGIGRPQPQGRPPVGGHPQADPSDESETELQETRQGSRGCEVSLARSHPSPRLVFQAVARNVKVLREPSRSVNNIGRRKVDCSSLGCRENRKLAENV